MLESTFHEDWDEIGSNRAKKGHLLLKSTFFSKLAGCQWVKDLICAKFWYFSGTFWPKTIEFVPKISF